MAVSDSSVQEPIYSELAQSDKDFAEIVELFVNGLVGRLESMQEALNNNDLDRLRRLAHQLKGTGGGHGYVVLTEKAADVEQHALAGKVDQLEVGLGELAALIARIKVLP